MGFFGPLFPLVQLITSAKKADASYEAVTRFSCTTASTMMTVMAVHSLGKNSLVAVFAASLVMVAIFILKYGRIVPLSQNAYV